MLSAFSFSKTYAMTGLRVGYLVAPEEMAAQSAKLQEPMIACVNRRPRPRPWRRCAARRTSSAPCARAVPERRDLAIGRLDEEGMGYLRPEGAFYLWVDMPGPVCPATSPRGRWTCCASSTWRSPPARRSVRLGEGWVRLSLATATEDLLEGIRRMGKAR